MKWMRMESFAQFARQFCQTCIHTRNVDRNIPLTRRERGRLEKWRHECDLVIFPAKIQLGSILPAVPECAHQLDLLAQFTCHRLRPGLAEPPLDVCFDLCA